MLGLLANGISAFLVLLQNFHGARTGVPAVGVENILAGIIVHCFGHFNCTNNLQKSCTYILMSENNSNLFALCIHATSVQCTYITHPSLCIMCSFIQAFISF